MPSCNTCLGRGTIEDPDPYADRRQMVTCRECGGRGNTDEIQSRIQALHDWYCRNVMAIRLTPEVERLWWEWLRAGYVGPDLRDVILYIRRQISQGKRNEGALKLTNLIQRSEAGFIGFDQDLGLARARKNLSTDKRLDPAPGSAPAPAVAPTPAPKAEPVRPAFIQQSLQKLKEAIE